MYAEYTQQQLTFLALLPCYRPWIQNDAFTLQSCNLRHIEKERLLFKARFKMSPSSFFRCKINIFQIKKKSIIENLACSALNEEAPEMPIHSSTLEIFLKLNGRYLRFKKPISKFLKQERKWQMEKKRSSSS